MVKRKIERGTAAERREVQRRLNKLYPNMMKKGWPKNIREKVAKGMGKGNVRTQAISSGLRAAGVDEDMIKRLRRGGK